MADLADLIASLDLVVDFDPGDVVGFVLQGGEVKAIERDVLASALSGATVTAADISLVDAGNYFATDDVESALQELGAGGGGGYSAENARDDVGAALVAGEGIDITLDDGLDTITVAAEDATDSNKGVVELATTAELRTGTDTTRSVTPAAAASALMPPSTTQSGTSFTVDGDDANSTIVCSNAALVTVTLPTDASDNLRVGFRCLLFAAGAAGVTLSTTGLTLVGSSPNDTIAQNEGLYVEKTGSNTWLVLGGTS
jgi:hypothetical protein